MLKGPSWDFLSIWSSWIPPCGGIPRQVHWGETPWKTQNPLEGLCIPNGMGKPQDLSRGAEEKDIWAFLVNLAWTKISDGKWIDSPKLLYLWRGIFMSGNTKTQCRVKVMQTAWSDLDWSVGNIQVTFGYVYEAATLYLFVCVPHSFSVYFYPL